MNINQNNLAGPGILNPKSLSLTNYLLVALTLLLGIAVKLTGSGSACGTSWPLCPPLINEPNLNSFIEFSHRLSSAVLGVTAILWLILSSKLSGLNKILNWIFIALLGCEAIIGKVIVRFGLPDAPLTDFKTFVYVVHPAVSATLLIIAALIHSGATSGTWISKQRILVFVGLLLMATSGALNSILLQEINAYSGARHVDVLHSYITTPLKLLHPMLGFFALIWAIWGIKKTFCQAVLATGITGLMIPIMKSKLMIFFHALAFVWCIHTLVFSRDERKGTESK